VPGGSSVLGGSTVMDHALCSVTGRAGTQLIKTRLRRKHAVIGARDIDRDFLIKREFLVCKDGGESKVLRSRTGPGRNPLRTTPVEVGESVRVSNPTIPLSLLRARLSTVGAMSGSLMPWGRESRVWNASVTASLISPEKTYAQHRIAF
jgi:hypothetical protein